MGSPCRDGAAADGLEFTALLEEDVESVTFSSNLLALTLDAKRWWEDDYAINWRDNLKEIGFPVPASASASPVQGTDR